MALRCRSITAALSPRDRTIPSHTTPEPAIATIPVLGPSFSVPKAAAKQKSKAAAKQKSKGKEEKATPAQANKLNGKKTKGQSSANTTGEEAIGSLGSRATEGVYHATASSPTVSGWGGRAASSPALRYLAGGGSDRYGKAPCAIFGFCKLSQGGGFAKISCIACIVGDAAETHPAKIQLHPRGVLQSTQSRASETWGLV